MNKTLFEHRNNFGDVSLRLSPNKDIHMAPINDPIIGASSTSHDNIQILSSLDPISSIASSSFHIAQLETSENDTDATSESKFNSPVVPSKQKMSLKRALKSTSQDDSSSPRKKRLMSKVRILKANVITKTKKIRILHQNIRRKSKRIMSLKNMLNELKTKNLIGADQDDMLANIIGPNSEIFERQLLKAKNRPKPKAYSAKIRQFALNLNFYSPKAYRYIRDTCDNCLPHPRTLSGWYKSTNCQPGFTTEAFSALKYAADEAEKMNTKIFVNLVYDEMAIREHIDWMPKQDPLGYVNFGDNQESDVKASQVLVFMAVCINKRWKISLGFFPIKSMTAEQKKSLIQHCIENILKTGIDVIGITFDGASTNVTACKELGCVLDYNKTEFLFTLDNSEKQIAILPDACHNIKLIRNTFADLSPLVDDDGGIINWKFIEELLKLQESEGLHLGNKIKKAHIYFRRQKMKVKLAVQVFSRSVADAIDFCREVICFFFFTIL